MTSPLCWQNWRIELPGRWSPVKLEGDYQQGAAAFGDLVQPRLAIRWSRKPPKKSVADHLAELMRGEVGALAAREARPPTLAGWETSLLYLEPEPPGRDIWIGYSAASKRCLLLAYHVRRRDRILEHMLLPTLCDLPADKPTPWSVFELSCIVDAGMKLASHQLNAGDLRLSFADGAKSCTVRQIAIAELALQRMPLEKWLAQQQRTRRRHYRSTGLAKPVELHCGSGKLLGLTAPMRRRRRFLFSRLPAELTTYALHDAARDRLVFVQSSHDEVARRVLASVGWAVRPKGEQSSGTGEQ